MRRSLALVLLHVAFGGAYGQNVSSPVDSAYTWLLLESASNELVRASARQFDLNFYQVFIDSVVQRGSTRYRLLVGQYESRDAARRDEAALPFPLRSQARLVRRPVDAMERITQTVAQTTAKSTLPADVEGADLARSDSTSDRVNTKDVLNVFIDCVVCGARTARREITFVNHVRDKSEAQVHLLVTRQKTGFGSKYTLNFIGRKEFEGVTDTLYYTSIVGETDDERRNNLVRRYKAGFLRYLARTPNMPDIIVSAVSTDGRRTQALQTTAADDPWKQWTFQIGVDGAYEGQEATNDFWVSSYVGANRTSDDWKIQLFASGSYYESNYEIGGGTITSSRENADASGQIIRSLGNHFAAGVFSSVSTSSFKNTDLSSTLASAFEYTMFPYAESHRRELRFSYYLNVRNFDYREITVFNKTSESLLHHEFQVHLDMRQPWGTAATTLSASQYLTDFEIRITDLYRLTLSGTVELRVAKGLSVFATADASRIRDQIYLRRKAASPEDVLLGRVQLPTSYQYNFTLGVSFTFGSIYNNIVNPRFGT